MHFSDCRLLRLDKQRFAWTIVEPDDVRKAACGALEFTARDASKPGSQQQLFDEVEGERCAH